MLDENSVPLGKWLVCICMGFGSSSCSFWWWWITALRIYKHFFSSSQNFMIILQVYSNGSITVNLSGNTNPKSHKAYFKVQWRRVTKEKEYLKIVVLNIWNMIFRHRRGSGNTNPKWQKAYFKVSGEKSQKKKSNYLKIVVLNIWNMIFRHRRGSVLDHGGQHLLSGNLHSKNVYDVIAPLL